MDTQLHNHLSNLVRSSVAAVYAYTASIGWFTVTHMPWAATREALARIYLGRKHQVWGRQAVHMLLFLQSFLLIALL